MPTSVLVIDDDSEFRALAVRMLAGMGLSVVGESPTKRYDRLTELSVTWFLEGRLSGGEDLKLGLVDDAVALVGIHPEVPPDIRRLVADEAARLRSEETRRS